MMKNIILLLTLCIVVTANMDAQTSSDLELVMEDGWKINGSLLTSQKENPLVIFISGSGPTDRDGNNPKMKNNCLKQLAESLAAANISSFRYDKRGIAASYDSSFTEENLRFSDYVNDLNTIVDRFKEEHEFSKIILAGHSEGALIGLLVAQKNQSVDAYISIAGAGRDAKTIIIEQLDKQMPALAKEAKIVFDSLQAGEEVRQINPFLMSIFRPSIRPYILEWASYDPAEELKKYKEPVLIIQGKHDIQVSLQDAEELKAAKPSANYAVIESMNHVLKNSGPSMIENIPTYNNPELPLNAEISSVVIKFIQSL